LRNSSFFRTVVLPEIDRNSTTPDTPVASNTPVSADDVVTNHYCDLNRNVHNPVAFADVVSYPKRGMNKGRKSNVRLRKGTQRDEPELATVDPDSRERMLALMHQSFLQQLEQCSFAVPFPFGIPNLSAMLTNAGHRLGASADSNAAAKKPEDDVLNLSKKKTSDTQKPSNVQHSRPQNNRSALPDSLPFNDLEAMVNLPADTRVPVVDLKDGRRVSGEDAPTLRNLAHWLSERPTCVIDMSSSAVRANSGNGTTEVKPSEDDGSRQGGNRLAANHHSTAPSCSSSAPVASTSASDIFAASQIDPLQMSSLFPFSAAQNFLGLPGFPFFQNASSENLREKPSTAGGTTQRSEAASGKSSKDNESAESALERNAQMLFSQYLLSNSQLSSGIFGLNPLLAAAGIMIPQLGIFPSNMAAMAQLQLLMDLQNKTTSGGSGGGHSSSSNARLTDKCKVEAAVERTRAMTKTTSTNKRPLSSGNKISTVVSKLTETTASLKKAAVIQLTGADKKTPCSAAANPIKAPLRSPLQLASPSTAPHPDKTNRTSNDAAASNSATEPLPLTVKAVHNG
uniref:BRK domain-containing protein n=1 Tax=Soboliphyme baturini TaxID=241478 RepID=A0A183IDA8_9BILA